MENLPFIIGTNAASFAIGALGGFLLANLLKGGMKTSNVVTFVVSLLWTASVAIDVYTQQTNTSWFLHAFFGSIIGASNKDFFDNLTKIISKR